MKPGFVLFIFERFSCLGFAPRIAKFSCVNALDSKTSITWFLLRVFGNKVFDAVTSANTATAHLVLLFCLRRCFCTSVNAFQVSKPRKKQAWKSSLKTCFCHLLSFPLAQGFVPSLQNRYVTFFVMCKRDRFDNLERNEIVKPICKRCVGMVLKLIYFVKQLKNLACDCKGSAPRLPSWFKLLAHIPVVEISVFATVRRTLKSI